MYINLLLTIIILLGNSAICQRVQIDPIENIPGIIFNKISDTVIMDKTYNAYSTIPLDEIFQTRKYDFLREKISLLGPLEKQSQEAISVIISRLNTLGYYRARYLSFDISSPGDEVPREAERAINTLNKIRRENHQSFFNTDVQEVYVDNSWSLKITNVLEEIKIMNHAFLHVNQTTAQSAIRIALRTVHSNTVLASEIIAIMEKINFEAWMWPISQVIDIITQNTSSNAPEIMGKLNPETIKISATVREGYYIITFSLPFVKEEVWSTYELLPFPAFMTKERLNTIEIQPRNSFLIIKPGTTEHFFASHEEMKICTKTTHLNICQPPTRIFAGLNCESGLLLEPSYDYMRLCDKSINKARKLYIIETSKPDVWIISTQEQTSISTYCMDQHAELQITGTVYVTIPDQCIANISNNTLKGGRQPRGPVQFFIPPLDIVSKYAKTQSTESVFFNTKDLILICIILLCYIGTITTLYQIIKCIKGATRRGRYYTNEGYYQQMESVDAELSHTGRQATCDICATFSQGDQGKDINQENTCPYPGRDGIERIAARANPSIHTDHVATIQVSNAENIRPTPHPKAALQVRYVKSVRGETLV